MLFSTCNRFVFRQKIKIYIGGGEFPKGGRYPRIFVPPGVIFLGISPLF
jgi:hypothetical protein